MVSKKIIFCFYNDLKNLIKGLSLVENENDVYRFL